MTYEKMSDTQLLRELGDLRKASFDSMFGHNARVAFNECADVLLSRGITEQPNIFGAIPIKTRVMEKVSMTNVAGTLQSIFKPMAKGWSAFPRSFKNARQLRREGRTQDARSVYEYILNNALDPEDKRKAQKGLDACRA